MVKNQFIASNYLNVEIVSASSEILHLDVQVSCDQFMIELK